LGAIVARRLHQNRHSGDFFGGIYATRLANFLEIDIREGDMELPPSYLDFDSMVSHQFVERTEPPLQYRLIFNRRRVVHIALPAPAFSDSQGKRRYIITREEADEYERRVEAARRHATAQVAIAAASRTANMDGKVRSGKQLLCHLLSAADGKGTFAISSRRQSNWIGLAPLAANGRLCRQPPTITDGKEVCLFIKINKQSKCRGYK